MAEENVVQTNIVATSNMSSLIGDLNRVSSALTGLQEKLNATNKGLATQVAVMNRTFAETLRSTGQFSTHFVSLASDVDKFGSQLDKGQLKLNQFFRVYRDHTRNSGNLIKDLAKQQVQLQNAILQPLGRNAEGLMQYNVHIPRGLDNVKHSAQLASQELAIMNKVVQEGANQLINWGKNTQWAGRQLTVGLTVPMAAFGKAAADAFKQADEQLVRLTKVYGGLTATSATELAKVRKDVSATAQELAKSYGASFNETLGLAADIAATGKQGNELLNSIKETTRLSVLGEVDRQEAMKATLAIQSAFKQNTEELAQSIDFLNAVENQTSTTLQDLVEAIPKAGPVVKGLGGDVKDLALYLTAMKEGGINAAEGANALKSGLASLINPTKVAKEMFAGFGIDLGGLVTRNAGNLTGMLTSLQTALDQLNPLQKQQALEQLFGKFQFARMNALFANLGKQGSQTLQVMDLMKASSQDLANIAGRELSQVTESASGKYRRAVEGLKSDLAGIGDQFLAINTTLINVIDKVVRFLDKLPDPVKKVLSFVGMLTATAGPLIMLTGVLGNFFGYIIKGVYHFKSLFKGAEGWKLLTPEILAANKAGDAAEATFYSDAKAAAILKQAIDGLSASYLTLSQRMEAGVIGVNAPITAAAAMAETKARQVNPGSRYISPIDTRSMSHHNPVASMTPEQRASQTMFGVTPGAPMVNNIIRDNPQMLMDTDLPKIQGVSAIKGVSTGIVAEEAAKWHAMTAALAMQSKAEIAKLKTEIKQTGLVTSSVSEAYDALLPQMNTITSNAAKASAQIVAELQQNKITADQARMKIMQMNTEIEAMMVQAAQSTALNLGRTVDVTKVPLLNQPVVDPNTGKSNMKEMLKSGRTRSLVNKIASVLGVKTYGAPYSIETTVPKRLNAGGKVYNPARDGNVVPGDTSINYDNTPAVLHEGGFILNQKASMLNPDLVRVAENGLNSGGKVVPALLTPGETYFPPSLAEKIMPTLEAANSGERVNFRALGGMVNSNQIGYGASAASLPKAYLSLAHLFGGFRSQGAKYFRASRNKWDRHGATTATFAEEGSGSLPYHLLRSRQAKLYENDILKQYGISPTKRGDVLVHSFPPRIVNRLKKLGYGVDDYIPKTILESLGIKVTGTAEAFKALPTTWVKNRSKFNQAIKKPRAKHSVDKNGKPNGWGDDGVWRPQKWDDMQSLLIKLKDMGVPPEEAKKIAQRAADNVNRITNGYQGEMSEEYWGKIINASELMAIRSSGTSLLAVGGKVTGGKKNYGYKFPTGANGIRLFKGLYKSPLMHSDEWKAYLEKSHADRWAKAPKDELGQVWDTPDHLRMMREGKINRGKYPMPKKWYQDLSNDDPMHGTLQIGRYQGPIHVRNQYVGAQIRYRMPVGQNWHDEGFSAPAPVLGTVEDRAKSALFRYMQGDYSAIHDSSVQSYLSTIRTKFSGTLHRGVNWRSTDSLPPFIKSLIAEKKWDELVGKEFIMRRASWSKNPKTAKGFGLGMEGKGYNQVILTADVKNRNAVPASEIFPDLTFQTPKGPVKVNESEVYMGGKFKIVSAANGKIRLQAVYDAPVDGKRENGGPVSGGRPYLVGEKGPEVFVPKNSGGIIPHYALGGKVKAAGTVAGILAQLFGQQIGEKIGSAVGGEQGKGVGGSIGAGVGTAAMFASFIPMFSGLGKAASGAEGQIGKFRKGLRMASLAIQLMPPQAKIAVVAIAAIGAGFMAWKKHAEAVAKTNRLAFAGAVQPLADFDRQLKKVRDGYAAIGAHQKDLIASNTGAGIPGVAMSVKDFEALKQKVKSTYPEIVKLFNQTPTNKLSDVVAGIKAQLMAAGDSAQSAQAKIAALLSQSDKSNLMTSTLLSSQVQSIKDIDSAAASMLKFLSKAQDRGGAEDFAGSLLQTFSTLDTAMVNASKKDGPLKALDSQFKAINSSQSKNIKLTQEQIDELAKTNPILAGMLSTSDNIGDAYAKWRIALAGVNKDLSGLNSSQLKGIAEYVTQVNDFFTKTGDVSTTEAQGGPLGSLAKTVDSYNKKQRAMEAASQNGYARTAASIKDQIKLKEKQIKQIQDEANARKKALQQQTQAEDIKLQIQQEQLKYQDALASGNMSAAAMSQLNIKRLVGQSQQTNAATAIDDAAQKKIDKLEKEIDALNTKGEALNAKTPYTAKTSPLTAIYADLNTLLQTIERDRPGAATSQDQKTFDSLMVQLRKLNPSLANEINPSGTGLVGSKLKSAPGPSDLLTLNNPKSTGDFNNLLSKTNDAVQQKIRDNTGQQIKELKIIQGLLSGRKDVGSGSGTKSDPYTVAKNDKYKNKNYTLTAGIDTKEIIKSNKLVRGDYFEYDGKLFLVDNGYDSRTRQPVASIVKKAQGGLLRGPGTGTSDSIFMPMMPSGRFASGAYVSNGEYIVKAAAVAQPGMLSLLDNINSMKYKVPSSPSYSKNIGTTQNTIGQNVYNTTFYVTESVDLDEAMRKWDQHIGLKNARIGTHKELTLDPRRTV